MTTANQTELTRQQASSLTRYRMQSTLKMLASESAIEMTLGLSIAIGQKTTYRSFAIDYSSHWTVPIAHLRPTR